MARMRVLTPEGPESRDITDPKEATNLGTYWNDVRYYVDTGDDERLRRHEGETYGGEPAVVDPDVIDELAYQDELDIEGIYETREAHRQDPIREGLRAHRRAVRLEPDAVCVRCLEPDLDVLAPRRIKRHLLEGHHVVLGRNDAELEIVLCLNCHAKVHADLLRVGVDPKRKESGFLDRLATALRALGSFFMQLARTLGGWASHLDSLIGGLDTAFPAWRELGEAGW